MKKFTKQEIRDLFNQVMLGEISFSRMVEMINEMVDQSEVSEFKDGDFVVNEAGSILIFRKKDEDSIYDHALFNNVSGLSITQPIPSYSPIRRHATEEEKQKLLDALAKEGKRWNAEKKCIEDIPKRKFKKGDKVRIKEGISSKTHYNIDPWFLDEMDDLIGKTMTVDRYIDCNNSVKCGGYFFSEDWLEPYEELKEGNEVFYAGAFYEVAEIKEFPHGIMIGIYDEPPSRHIDYLNPESVSEVYPCYACQGEGCPVCGGYGRLVQ